MAFKPKKTLGQNFLTDQSIARELAETAGIKKDETVLEIGAGAGTVTRELAPRARKVIAVEIDRGLIPALNKNIREFAGVEIVNADVLDLDLSNYRAARIIGAIPYQITSPLLHKILHSPSRPKSITFIVQKEVAEKITAAPPDATYLSNFVANFGEARLTKVIPPAAFSPRPKVDSAIIHIEIYPNPKIEDTVKLEKFLHHGFLHPRKMIHHQFESDVLAQTKIPPQARPAHLSKEDWHRLYRELSRGQERVKSRRGGGLWRSNN